jgi:ribosomal protein L12E/L44/L45/RPP1/RPP2
MTLAQRSLFVQSMFACVSFVCTMPLLQADNLNALITASGNEVQPYWGNLISTFVAGKDLDEFLLKPGTLKC